MRSTDTKAALLSLHANPGTSPDFSQPESLTPSAARPGFQSLSGALLGDDAFENDTMTPPPPAPRPVQEGVYFGSPPPPVQERMYFGPPPPPLQVGATFDPPPPPPPPRAIAAKRHPLSVRNPAVIEQRHEDLQDEREDLMGTRFRLQSIRKQVRGVREDTGIKEGIFIRRLRGFLLEQGLDVPPDVSSDLDEVYAAREKLGSLEAEYDELEETYHYKEMRYTQNEGKFIDDLIADGAGTPTRTHPDASATRAHGLTSFALGSPDGWNTQRSSIAGSKGFGVPTEHVIPPEQRNSGIAQNSSVIQPAHSGQSDQGTQRLPQKLNERRHTDSQHEWEDTRKRINEWLLRMISESTFQQAQLKAWDATSNMDTKVWWERGKRAWSLVSPGPTQAQMRKSTYSHGIVSQHHSVSDPGVLHSANMDAKAPRPSALLPEEQTLDALDDPENPPSIKSGDLCEAGLKGDDPPTMQNEHKVNVSIRPTSTEPASTHWTFWSEDAGSSITNDGACSCRCSPDLRVTTGHPECEIHHKGPIHQVTSSREYTSLTTTPRPIAKETEASQRPLCPSPSILSPKPTIIIPEIHILGVQRKVLHDHLSEEHDPGTECASRTPTVSPDRIPLPASPEMDTPRASQSRCGSPGIPHCCPKVPPVLTKELELSPPFQVTILRLATRHDVTRPTPKGKSDLQWLPLASLPAYSP